MKISTPENVFVEMHTNPDERMPSFIFKQTLLSVFMDLQGQILMRKDATAKAFKIFSPHDLNKLSNWSGCNTSRMKCSCSCSFVIVYSSDCNFSVKNDY